MRSNKYALLISVLSIFNGSILFIYILRQQSRTDNQTELTGLPPVHASHKELYEQTDQNISDVYHQMLTDISQYNVWSLLSFMTRRKEDIYLARYALKKKICILSVDSRPLERFSEVNDLNNMSFHSIAAYNSLFYGK
jgi:hypothetical protein